MSGQFKLAFEIHPSTRFFNAWISSSLFMRSALLIYCLCWKWRMGIIDRIVLLKELCQEIEGLLGKCVTSHLLKSVDPSGCKLSENYRTIFWGTGLWVFSPFLPQYA